MHLQCTPLLDVCAIGNAAGDALVGAQLVLETGGGDCQTLASKTLKNMPDALVGAQLVFEGGGGDSLLPRDAAGRATDHVAHVHNGRDEVLAALRVRRALHGPASIGKSGSGFWVMQACLDRFFACQQHTTMSTIARLVA